VVTRRYPWTMPNPRALQPSGLPEVFFTTKGWSGTKHTLGDSPNQESDHSGPLEYLLVSKLDEHGMPRLWSLGITFGEGLSQTQRKLSWNISNARTDFIEPVVKSLKKSDWIDVQALYDNWNASTARTILTGHYLATRHKKLFDGWHRAGNSKIELKEATNEYWNTLADEAGGITRLTVYVNEELQAWGNSFSSSLLAQLMGVGPRTIHTRLYEAQKYGYLHSRDFILID
jgi:hypothetical protein